MQKLIGSISIILACTGIGFMKSGEANQHLKELEELRKIFVLLRSELTYTKAPFSELFLRLSQKTEGVFQVWLRHLAEHLETRREGTLEEIWSNSVMDCLRESRLNKKELDELCRIGNRLGYMETLELYLEQLAIAIENTREELKNKKKLYQSMGIMAGVFLVIVLL